MNYINWIKLHLNLSYLIFFLICGALGYLSYGILQNDIVGLFVVVLYFIGAGWVLKMKARSLWWLILSPYLFAPLWLANAKIWKDAEKQYEAEKRDKQE